MVWLLILLVIGVIVGNLLLLKYSAKVGWPTPEQLKQKGITAQPDSSESKKEP